MFILYPQFGLDILTSFKSALSMLSRLQASLSWQHNNPRGPCPCQATAAAAAAKSLQSCPTLCDPRDRGPPGFPVPGVLQARTLEWVAISFSNAGKWKVKVKSLSRVRLFTTPWTAAHQAPPSLGFSRQEYWSGVPLPSPEPLQPNLTPLYTMFDPSSLWPNSRTFSKSFQIVLPFPPKICYTTRRHLSPCCPGTVSYLPGWAPRSTTKVSAPVPSFLNTYRRMRIHCL